MKYTKVLSFLTVALAALPAISYAQVGYVSKMVNLRAGPAPEYPVVAILQPGVQVTVVGCLSDYRWCDVTAGPHQGWIYAANIAYPYQGSNVPILGYGAAIGLGVVAFSLGSYWDNHYRGRPWYGQRHTWANRPGPMPGHRPLPGVGPGPHRPLPGPAFGPGGHRPPPPGPGAHRPPGPVPGPHRPPGGPVVRPGDHRPPGGPAARPDQGHRPAQGQGPGAGNHRPQREQGSR